MSGVKDYMGGRPPSRITRTISSTDTKEKIPHILKPKPKKNKSNSNMKNDNEGEKKTVSMKLS
jgi:hypothetical protein